MRMVSSLQLKFDSRAKEIENKWIDKFDALRKQVDGRWKQLDGLENSVKSAAELHKQWRLKANDKTRELDEVKVGVSSTHFTLANEYFSTLTMK